MFVGCKLPFGFTIDHLGVRIALNGANADYDADNPWRNGHAPDSPLRASGVGLTQLDGDAADAFKDWYVQSGKGDGPVKSGAIFFTEKQADATKEAAALEGKKVGIAGLDPEADLPKGLETDQDATGKSKG
jgi:hypothetical protein